MNGNSEGDHLSEIFDDFTYDQRVKEYWEQLDFKISLMGVRYGFAKKSFVGETIKCACCGKPFIKKSYQQAFCSNKGRKNCKDSYWNTVDDSRRLRAYKWA